jgi:hypothetical protein
VMKWYRRTNYTFDYDQGAVRHIFSRTV